MGSLVGEYYLLLRSIRKTQPHVKCSRTRCRQCGIFFLTHPRNRGRKDLRCPFGCREIHRRKESTRRSVDYYRGEHGRILKGYQNAKRRTTSMPPPARPPPAPCPEPVVQYVRQVVSWIEGRPVSREEILEMLARTLRQHRMVRRRRIDQTLSWLNAHPP